MASSKLTRKTLTPGGTEPKKSTKTPSFTSGMKAVNKSIAKTVNTANKSLKSAAKSGVSTAGKAVIGASKAVGNLPKKAVSTAKKGIAGMSDLVYRGKPKSHEQARKEWIEAERNSFTKQKAEGTNSLEKAIGKATPLKNSSKKVSKKVKY